MKIIVTGATGMVGAEVLRQAIDDDTVESVTAIARKPLDIQHPKINTVVHKDFLNYTGVEELFKTHDVCIWCLGISQSQVKKEEYIVITYDYAIAAAKAMLAANPGIKFIFLSGDGADQNEKARSLFGRIKGRTEKQLATMGFRHLYFARPGAIWPKHQNPNAPFIYKLFIPLFPVLNLFFSSAIIKSDALAKALIKLAETGSDKMILDNKDLKALGS